MQYIKIISLQIINFFPKLLLFIDFSDTFLNFDVKIFSLHFIVLLILVRELLFRPLTLDDAIFNHCAVLCKCNGFYFIYLCCIMDIK